MVLSESRINEIAFRMLKIKMEREGINLNPKEVKREITNEAKNLGVTPQELAEFAKLIYTSAYRKVMAELELMSPSSRSEESEKTMDRMLGEHALPQTKVEEKEQLPAGTFLKE
jgi:hypothetical protein